MKLIMNSLFGDSIRKDINYNHEMNTELCKETENDDRVEEYHKLKIRRFFVKNKNYQKMDFGEGTSKIKRLFSQLGAIIFSNIKRTKNPFIK